MIAIRGSALLRARTRQLPRAARRGCRGNESSFASFFSSSFLLLIFRLPTRCCCYHLSQKLIRLAACSHASRRAEYTKRWPLFKEHANIRTREKLRYKYFKYILYKYKYQINILLRVHSTSTSRSTSFEQ